MDETTKSKRPSDNKIKQQKMWAFKPRHSVCSILVTFGVLGSIFFLLGGLALGFALDVDEYSERYDNLSNCEPPLSCTISFDLDSELSGPVYLYYEMESFYQNHRLYVKSRSFPQLKGESLGPDELDRCSPIRRNRDLDVQNSFWGQPLRNSDAANPCGLSAKSIFDDEFTLFGPTGQIPIKNYDLTWESDFDFLYERNKNYREKQWLDVEDERFAVWMKIAVHPSFRKLWGIIDTDLEKGTYTMTVKNNFDVSDWDGKKWFVLSEANSLGGRNFALGLAFIAGGIICMSAVIAACVLSFTVSKEPRELKWK